jgi:hypothetical protein
VIIHCGEVAYRELQKLMAEKPEDFRGVKVFRSSTLLPEQLAIMEHGQLVDYFNTKTINDLKSRLL